MSRQAFYARAKCSGYNKFTQIERRFNENIARLISNFYDKEGESGGSALSSALVKSIKNNETL